MNSGGGGWRWTRAALWSVWAISVVAACYATFVGVLVWLINCPGTADVSAQRARCDALGDEGGTIVLSVALIVATGLSFFMMRRSGNLATWRVVLLLGAWVMPPLLPVATFAVLTAPHDYCTPEQQRAEDEAERKWEAKGERGSPPDWCSAFEGDV